MPTDIEVEVVFARPDRQRLVTVVVPDTASVADAIAASGLALEFPDENLDALEVGIWGRIVEKERPLSAGDRVEIYRPLELDPREARRQRAAAGATMGRPKEG